MEDDLKQKMKMEDNLKKKMKMEDDLNFWKKKYHQRQPKKNKNWRQPQAQFKN
jgi:hypothetical protein